jgi:hypothetical protein
VLNPLADIAAVVERHGRGLIVDAMSSFGAIDIDASRELSDPLLAAPHGGHVLVRQQNERWVPERAIYKVVLTTLAPHSPDDGPPLVMRGTVSIDANPASLAGEWLLNALAVLLRELQP